MAESLKKAIESFRGRSGENRVISLTPIVRPTSVVHQEHVSEVIEFDDLVRVSGFTQDQINSLCHKNENTYQWCFYMESLLEGKNIPPPILQFDDSLLNLASIVYKVAPIKSGVLANVLENRLRLFLGGVVDRMSNALKMIEKFDKKVIVKEVDEQIKDLSRVLKTFSLDRDKVSEVVSEDLVRRIGFLQESQMKELGNEEKVIEVNKTFTTLLKQGLSDPSASQEVAEKIVDLASMFTKFKKPVETEQLSVSVKNIGQEQRDQTPQKNILVKEAFIRQ